MKIYLKKSLQKFAVCRWAQLIIQWVNNINTWFSMFISHPFLQSVR